MATESSIISDISARFSGQRYKDCYIGIAADARDRLFNGHGVSEDSGLWIYRTAVGHRVARNVEQHFLNAGMDGGPSGGDQSTRQVYAYKKTSSTQP
jgi:hypothetical protein